MKIYTCTHERYMLTEGETYDRIEDFLDAHISTRGEEPRLYPSGSDYVDENGETVLACSTVDPTDSQIRALRDNARRAGDDEQCIICTNALNGDESAIEECGDVLEQSIACDDSRV